MRLSKNIYGILFFLLFPSCAFQNKLEEIDPNIKIDKEYHNNGKIHYELTYKYGKLDGVSKTWDSSGNLMSEVEYSNGLPNGLWKTYYKNGKMKNSINYVRGLKDGYEIWYYDNGQKQSETLYENNEIIIVKRWSQDGKIISN